MKKLEDFEAGMYLIYTGEDGPRWIHNDIYVYLGNGCVTDKDGDIKKPTYPDFIIDKFVSCNNWYNRDYIVNFTDREKELYSKLR